MSEEEQAMQTAAGAAERLVPEFPCGREGVLALIPHRDPFVWVSRILECEPGRHIVAELDVDPDLPLFKGHFPGKPVQPGVIQMEAPSGCSRASTRRSSASRCCRATPCAWRPPSRRRRASCAWRT